MERKGKAICALLLVQLLAWGVFVPTADAGKLVRVSSQFRRFNSDFDTTTAGPSSTPGAGGLQIYTKTFNVPTPKTSGQQPVIFVSISGFLYTESSSFVAFSCKIDGAFCNPGTEEGLGLTGWVIGDFVFDEPHARMFHYTWCAKVNPGTHTASLRMASNGSGVVSLWSAHYYIDRTEFTASTADDCELGAP